MENTKTWVDFRAVKSAVTMEAVLAHYGVKNLKRVGDELRGRCPIHKSEAAGTFHANVVKNCFQCFAAKCKKRGNVLDFVAAMEGCTIRDAAIKLHTWFAVPNSGGAVGERSDTPPDTGKGETVNKPLAFTLKSIDHTHPYLESRGVPPELAEQFGMGFFSGRGSMSGRIVIPIHNELGELVAYAGRAIDDTEPRYKLPASFQKSAVLYNLHRVSGAEERKGSVVVVEGFFDCVKVTAAGFTCVALMGSSMSGEQEELLIKRFKAVRLLLDGDESGRTAAAECSARLVNHLFTRVVRMHDGMQPDCIAVEEIRHLLG